MTIVSSTDSGRVATHDHGWTLIVKSADQLVTNSNALVDDTELQFTTVANTNYIIRLHVFWNTSNSGADYQYWVKHDGTTSRAIRRIVRNVAGAAPAETSLVASFDVAATSLTTTVAGYNVVEETIILQVGASGGLFHIQFAQVTAVAGNSVTHYEGSTLEYAIT